MRPIHANDEELMLRFLQQEDQQSFSLLYNRYFPVISKYISWLCHDLDLAKDLTQQLFIKIYQRPELFDSSKTFKPWIYSIAQNHWKNHVRNEQVAKKHQAQLVHESEVLKKVTSQSWEKQNLSAENQGKLFELSLAIDHLSAAHKEIFLLKYSSNLTIQEISEVCNCSPGTVKSRLFYSIKKIRALLFINQKSQP